MSVRKLISIGGGEHARVVLDAALSRPDQWQLAGFVDPRPCADTVKRFGLPRISSDAEAIAHTGDCWFILGIGQMSSASLRRSLVESYGRSGARWATVMHAAAIISPTAAIGEGVVVFAGAVINTGAAVRRHVVVNTGAVVEHDVQIGAFAMIAPRVVIGGGAEIGEDVSLGMGCSIRDHVRVGRGSTVGMGAAVVHPVSDGVRVMGIPARERVL